MNDKIDINQAIKELKQYAFKMKNEVKDNTPQEKKNIEIQTDQKI